MTLGVSLRIQCEYKSLIPINLQSSKAQHLTPESSRSDASPAIPDRVPAAARFLERSDNTSQPKRSRPGCAEILNLSQSSAQTHSRPLASRSSVAFQWNKFRISIGIAP